MTQTTKQYHITAFDRDHAHLWIDPSVASTNHDADGDLHINHIASVLATYAITKMGYLVDPETGRPVTSRKRAIAYFRVYDNGRIFEIYATRHGRKAGIRNYQMRSPGDRRAANIVGHAPIHTAPRVVWTGYSYEVHIGEGDPRGLRAKGTRNVDRWGDAGIHLGTCHRVTLADTEGSWWGYTYENHYTWDHCPLQNATAADARRHLLSEAEEMIGRYGADIARW
jgi:hypothetical protein